MTPAQEKTLRLFHNNRMYSAPEFKRGGKTLTTLVEMGFLRMWRVGRTLYYVASNQGRSWLWKNRESK